MKNRLTVVLLSGVLWAVSCAMPILTDSRGKLPSSNKWELTQTLVMPPGIEGVWIGLSGDTMVARLAFRDGKTATRVYERREGVWSLGQELRREKSVEPDGWSWNSVAVDRDTFFSGNQIFVRRKGSWVLEQEIRRAVDGAAVMLMGLSGDTLVARPAQPSGQGAVYVFLRDRGVWTESAKLTGPDDLALSIDDKALAISGDRILAGTKYSGEAYVYVRRARRWVVESTLTEQGLGLFSSSNAFGFSVSLNRDTAVVRSNPNWTTRRSLKCLFAGPECDEPWGPNLAHLFERRMGGWVQTAKFGAVSLGSDVAIDGQSVIFDACCMSERQGSTWSRLEALPRAFAGTGEQRYGYLALEGKTLAIAGTGNGSTLVRVFQRPAP